MKEGVLEQSRRAGKGVGGGRREDRRKPLSGGEPAPPMDLKR